MTLLRFLNMLTNGRNGFILELFLCEMMFSYKSKHRKIFKIPFAILFIVVYAAYAVASYFIPLFRTPSLMSLTIFAISVLAAWAVFDVKINRILFNCVAGYAVQNLAVNVVNTCYTIIFECGGFLTGWASFFVRLAIKLLIYVGCYFAFARKSMNAEMNIPKPRLYITSLLTIVVTSVLFSVVRNNGSFGLEINIAMTLCGILALLLQFSEFHSGNLNKETATLERLLYYEQKQHEITQETIDIINIKCHDLKKQVTAFKELLGDKADDMLGDTEKVITAYDEMVKTGNKTLDLTIYEEKNYCRKYGITLDVMADGAQLDFMAPSDIYSLFSNALNNAVESVMYEEEGNKNIGLDIHLNGDYVCIKITNMCTRQVKFSNSGLPVTSKEDKKYHGYGIRSMEYIVAKYGGNMVVNFENCLFTVKIIIKKPS